MSAAALLPASQRQRVTLHIQPVEEIPSMGTSHGAVLAIWHDIARDEEDAVLEWYNREHHPERLSVPGFLCARRFRAERAPTFFINYEVRNAEVLSSPAYIERLNNPTPWTRRSMPHFRNNVRTVCVVTKALGQAQGGHLATARFTPQPGKAESLRDVLLQDVLPDLAGRLQMVSAQLWEGLPALTTIPTAERDLRQQPDMMADWCIALSASSSASLRSALSWLTPERLVEWGAAPQAVIGFYQLEYQLGGAS